VTVGFSNYRRLLAAHGLDAVRGFVREAIDKRVRSHPENFLDTLGDGLESRLPWFEACSVVYRGSDDELIHGELDSGGAPDEESMAAAATEVSQMLVRMQLDYRL